MHETSRQTPTGHPWPYFWTPRDDQHALYEAKVGGTIYLTSGLLILAGGVVVAVAADKAGEYGVSAAMLLFGLSTSIWAIRYSANCYLWVSERIGPPANIGRAVPMLLHTTGTGISALDRFGQRWGGLINLVALILGVVSLWVSLR
jgi:hypothetical protein